MRVIPTNFNIRSDSGPNTFSRGLFKNLSDHHGVELSNVVEESDIEFSLIESPIERTIPRITRLDGIYFNTSQDFNLLNKNIKRTYENSDSVVFQSNFNKMLISEWFGEHNLGKVILNGANTDQIKNIPVAQMTEALANKKIWSCASSWRPHKRLRDNIRYFVEKSEKDTILLIAGKGITKEDFEGYESLVNKRIFYVGHIPWNSLVSMYKASDTFIHLSFLDHCPNVVVDAAACGCKIVCASSGGTSEIHALEKIVVQDIEWDFSPIELYNPPSLDFESTTTISSEGQYTLKESASLYYDLMEKTIEKS